MTKVSTADVNNVGQGRTLRGIALRPLHHTMLKNLKIVQLATVGGIMVVSMIIQYGPARELIINGNKWKILVFF